ncbi:MAG: hypothetical protein ABSD42_10465 [Candidatus Bathyarchaeia archaeon]|jgi:hypothetical protein
MQTDRRWKTAREQCGNRNTKPDALTSQNYLTSKQRDPIGFHNKKTHKKYNRNERIRIHLRRIQHNLCKICRKSLDNPPGGQLIIHHIEKNGELIEVLVHEKCSHLTHGDIFIK